MLLDLKFSRLDETDEIWLHRELETRNLRLHFFNDSYHFVHIGTIQGIGTMVTLNDLIDGFDFVTSGEKFT